MILDLLTYWIRAAKCRQHRTAKVISVIVVWKLNNKGGKHSRACQPIVSHGCLPAATLVNWQTCTSAIVSNSSCRPHPINADRNTGKCIANRSDEHAQSTSITRQQNVWQGHIKLDHCPIVQIYTSCCSENRTSRFFQRFINKTLKSIIYFILKHRENCQKLRRTRHCTKLTQMIYVHFIQQFGTNRFT